MIQLNDSGNTIVEHGSHKDILSKWEQKQQKLRIRMRRLTFLGHKKWKEDFEFAG